MTDSQLEDRLARLATALINQAQARVIVPPQAPSSGFWFGGGNLVEGPDGNLHLVGRYRNYGDSRTGLSAGERGLELAIFSSADGGRTWEKSLSFSKSDLDMPSRRVLSIEGSALRWTEVGIELFVSTEKDGIGCPAPFEGHLKPGTGVWTIERITATTLSGLKNAPLETVIECRDPQWLHIKDPFVYQRSNGDTVLLFCSHPYCWSSSNTGYIVRAAGGTAFGPPNFGFFPRGFTWDVAMTRGTCVVDVPQAGVLKDEHISLMFYDGGESLRNMDEHASSVSRPRGYSCEEIGGAAWIRNGDLHSIERLSKYQPLFVSPWGTGCSRYVDVLVTSSGDMIATWQQSQPDGSQPLVLHSLSSDQVAAILS